MSSTSSMLMANGDDYLEGWVGARGREVKGGGVVLGVAKSLLEENINCAIGVDIVMSDSEDSTVTYTAVSSPFGGLSDIRSSGVDGPPVMPEDPYAYVVAAFQAPPSPDYVPGPEYPPLPEFVPEPVYPEFMPPEDDVLPAKEQPLPAAVSPTADSPGYVPESDPEEDPEEDDDEDPEEDPADYPTDRDDDDDEEEPSGDEADDEEEDEDDEEEEEEHPALADSVPPPVHRVTARISIRPQTPVSLPSDTEISSPLLPVSPPPPASPTYPLESTVYNPAKSQGTIYFPIHCHYHHPSYSPAPDQMHHHQGQPKLTYNPYRLHLPITAYEVGEASAALATRPTGGFRADYGFIATLDREIRRDPKREGRSMDVSDLARFEVMALRTQVVAQQSKIAALRAADRARQAQLVETLRLMSTLQTHVTAL
ncbi:hypothetical protein Tco_1385586 [Tanacetum coccineum]